MLKKYCKLQSIIILLWISLFSFNVLFNNFINHNDYIAIIFLPAGLKITLTCLYGKRAFLGLFIGTLLTALLYIDSLLTTYVLTISLISASSPILALWLINHVSPLGKNLEYLNVYKILSIACSYAFINSFLHNTYLFYIDAISLKTFQINSLMMFAGDILGSLLFLAILSLFKDSLIKFFNKYLANVN